MFFKIDNQETSDSVINPEDLISSRLVLRSPSEAIKPVIAPPPPPEDKKGKGEFISRCAGFINTLLFLGCLILFMIPVFEKASVIPGPLQMDKIIMIPRDAGVKTISDILNREKVISSESFFYFYIYINELRNKFKNGIYSLWPSSRLKAGEFNIKAHASVSDVVSILTEGKSVLHSITIPEGLTSEQIVLRLRGDDALVGDINEIPKEGSLLPDTYKFERGMTRQQLLTKMQKEQERVLDRIWERRYSDLPLSTRKELLILASIVEKETGRADERSQVAAVFLNRLAKGMKLQSDPTIVYGLVGGKGSLGRGILRSEIREPTPYNTYVIDGLPPGPIANPGRASLEAVSKPSRTTDLYFVADGNGGHIFAETYEQHQKNVARWRQIEKSRMETVSGAALQNTIIDKAMPQMDVPGPGIQLNIPDGAGEALMSGTNQTTAQGFDASEGTEKDPLLDKSFDLESPQDVPALEEYQ